MKIRKYRWMRRRHVRRRRPQVTCWCGAYEFPHRILGGMCTGATWAECYFLYEKEACAHCPSNAGTYCEVATGQEHAKYCEGIREHLRMESGDRLPYDDEYVLQKVYALFGPEPEEESVDIPF